MFKIRSKVSKKEFSNNFLTKKFVCFIFFLYLCSRVRQIELTDVTRRHKAHYCHRSPHHNFLSCVREPN